MQGDALALSTLTTHLSLSNRPDLCHNAKRFLSEETMATCFQLQQLDLATHTVPGRPGQLNIQMVASCLGESCDKQERERSDVQAANGTCYCSRTTSPGMLMEANLRQEQPLAPAEEDDNLQRFGSMDDCSSLSSSDGDSQQRGNHSDLWQTYHKHNIFSCLSHPRQTVRLSATSPPAPPYPPSLEQDSEHMTKRTNVPSRYPGVNIKYVYLSICEAMSIAIYM